MPGWAGTSAECIDRPEAWASRWRTVEPGGPAGVSSSTALLDRNLGRARDQRFGDRRQPERPADVSVPRKHSPAADDRRRGVGHRPAGDQVQGSRHQGDIEATVSLLRSGPMSRTVRGVISRSKGAPVELVDIVIPDPGPGEVVVAVQACGVCHTDLTYRDGGINDSYPFLLGHEAAGVVESVGDGVTHVEPGDYVILNWRAVCGQCRACKRGRPWYCFNTFNATRKMTLTDGIGKPRHWASAHSPTKPLSTKGSAPRLIRRPTPPSRGCSVAA